MNKLYSTRKAFETYVYFLAIQRHFKTTSYDFFKFNGKLKVSLQSFENRKDKFYFYKLSKVSDCENMILSNIVENQNIWVGDMFEDKADRIYKEWLKRQQSITYTFKKELSELDENFNSNIIVTDGQHPRLLKLYLMNRISLETLTILCNLTKCLGHWDKKISDKIVYPDINMKVRKYSPFLQYEKEKMRKIVLDKHNAI